MAFNPEALGKISVRMTSSLELGEVLGELTRGLVGNPGAALARIWLIGPGDRCATCPWRTECDHVRCLHLVASSGLSENLEGSHARVPIGKLKIGQIAATRTPVCLNDLTTDDRITDKAWVKEQGLRSFGGYPLEFGGELLGVLGIFSRQPLTAEEFERLGMFAAQAAIALKNAQLFSEVSELTRRLQAENAYLREELEETESAGIVGESEPLRRALRELDRVAPTASTVLLRGETGTGKELFARAIHERSPRREKPLIKVNCAAIPPALVESELFGHERGAFTGAVQRRLGRFELANGGTLLLDEIGELPLEAQAKLLRVVQEQELERVGGTRPIPIDVRIVGATNRDLAEEVRKNRFRADLFYRLNVFPITIPPLRERPGDIPLLAEAFVRNLGRRLGRSIEGIDEDAWPYLQSYAWPGNVRELQNVLERAAILASGRRIGIADLPELTSTADQGAAPTNGSRSGDAVPLKQRVDAFERTIILEALRDAGGNQSEAARRLSTRRATLQYKMKTLGL
jgi:transcriptional regulator with GAF, ATPase, and Fis domain